MDLLIAGHPMHSIQRGEPSGSRGVGYVMNVTNADFQNLYVEMVIEDDTAWVLSFHISKHAKGS